MPKVLVFFAPQTVEIDRATLISYLLTHDETFTGLDGLTDEQLLERITHNFDALQALNEDFILGVDADKVFLKRT